MAATLTSSGTWTALASSTTEAGRTKPNLPNLPAISASDLGTIPDEVRQIVQLVSDGYTLGHWPAAVLLRTWLTAYINKETPKVSGYTG